ncbi:KUP/HAK/KT family potassium transporter [Seleniivibrio woodruffii]|uniref:KUP/HAK/KT family potassium transporter n=1 Tax=Seleniivibrio woodruffii TaxID=1078050 RepID=UPI0026EB797A|nr:KUP/HAK/KT family potassium transporter [Seleniivibrio woodruffii]
MLTRTDWAKIVKSLGLVFGDIGTSPIYTLTVIFLLLEPTKVNIMGVVSLIFWTMFLLVTVEYAWLSMSLSKRGEGGTIVLMEILTPLLKSGRKTAFFTLLTYIGVSLLVGDGVITPAISILSAVEGLRQLPAFSGVSQGLLIFIAALIAIGLFSVQSKGTEKVAVFFGPVMLVWFSVLLITGIASLSRHPEILLAVNPFYAVEFVGTHGVVGFFVLSEVILCATGGEALYADMGHFGRAPIIRAWSMVFFVLVFCYMGQASFLLEHTDAKNILFEMVYSQAPVFYIPFLLLSVMATIIASQAMISGMFSVMYQAITTRILPLLKVDYTSDEMRSQIYIPTVNWFLLFCVLIAMFVFQNSEHMAAAYGLAVTGSMTITGIIISCIFFIRKDYIKCYVAVFVTVIDILFLSSNMLKIPHGGFWSLLIASVPFIVIVVYTKGGKRMYRAIKPVRIEDFLKQYEVKYLNSSKLDGTGLFFIRDVNFIPPYIAKTIFINNIIYKDNIFISVNVTDEPFGISWQFKEDLSDGLRVFDVRMGYMVSGVDIDKIFKNAGINEAVVFYGVEDIMTDNPIWKFYSLIRKVTPSFVQFYRLPADKLHGVVTRVNL